MSSYRQLADTLAIYGYQPFRWSKTHKVPYVARGRKLPRVFDLLFVAWQPAHQAMAPA